MKPKILLLLVALMIPVIGLSVLTLNREKARVAAEGLRGPLFPELRGLSDRIASVRIHRGDKPFTVTKKDGTNDWYLPGRSNYPAKMDKLRTLVQSLVDTQLVDERTADPSNYALISVQDPGVKGPTDQYSSLVEFFDKDNKPLASVIVGQAKSQQGFINDPNQSQTYVRKTGDKQSWLVTGSIEVDAEELGWTEREVLNIPKERVKSARIERGDGTVLSVSRETPTQPNFTLAGIPEGRELRVASSPDQLGSVLSFVTLEDVKPAGEVDMTQSSDPANTFKIHVVCFDGSVYDALVVRKPDDTNADGKFWITVTPSFEAAAPADPTKPADPTVKTPEAVKAEIEAQAAKVKPWVYQVSDYKGSSFTKSMEDFLKPVGSQRPGDMPAGMMPMQGPTMPPGLGGPGGPMPLPPPTAAPPATPAPTPADAPKPEGPK